MSGDWLTHEELLLDFSEIESLPVENVRSNIEHITKHVYSYDRFHCSKKPEHIKINSKKTKLQRIDAFGQRLVPDPGEKLPGIIKDYVGKGILGGYRTRKSPPFLILAPEEIALMVHLPDPNTKNLTLTRKQSLPQQQLNKTGFCLGYQSLKNTLSYEPQGMLGKFVHAAQTKSVVISPEDIPTHMYAVGGTGSGKTTLIRTLAKHLELANISGTYPNSFIFIDPKGSGFLPVFETVRRRKLWAKQGTLPGPKGNWFFNQHPGASAIRARGQGQY